MKTLTLALLTATAISLAYPATAQDIGDFKFSIQRADHDDWLLADGRAVSRTTRADLFTAMGTAFGVGDGSTTFNLPDLRGRLPMAENNSNLPNGTDTGLSTRDVGDVAGAETQTLAIGEIPSHDHGAGSFAASGGTPEVLTGLGGEEPDPTDEHLRYNPANGSPATGLQWRSSVIRNAGGGAVTGTSGTTGSGTAHSILGPVAVVGNAFVFAGEETGTDPYFSNVVLLAPLTTVIDEDLSNSNHTLTALGDAAISGGHLELDGTGDSVTAPDSSDWDFGTGDFTIELFLDMTGAASYQTVITTSVNGIPFGGWLHDIRAPGITPYNGSVFVDEGTLVSGSSGLITSATDRVHIAIARESGTVRMFIDGTLHSTTSYAGAIDTPDTAGLAIGGDTNNNYNVIGDIDNVRITKGVARYTATFTVPSTPFPAS